MEWQTLVAILSAVMVPLSGLFGGWISDRRAKKQFVVTSKQSQQTVEATAKEAANHEFEVITSGFTSYIDRVEKQNQRLEETNTKLEQQNVKLEKLVDEMDARFQELNRRHQTALDHIDELTALVPVEQLPRRPKGLGDTGNR